MSKVVKVKAGWIKRLPSGNIGPFKTEKEALNAYANPVEKKVNKVVQEKDDFQKKTTEKKFTFKEEKKEDK